MLYVALVETQLRYGIECWGCTYFNKITPIVIDQKYLIRAECQPLTFIALFYALNFLPLKHLYFYKAFLIFFIRSSDKALKYKHVEHELRSKENFVLANPCKEYFQ